MHPKVKEFLTHVGDDLLVRLGVDWLQRKGAEGSKQEPLKLPGVLLKLSPEERKNVTQWLQEKGWSRRRQLEQFAAEDLEKFLKLPEEERDQMLEALAGGIVETLDRLKEELERRAPELPKTTARLQQWGEWGKRIRRFSWQLRPPRMKPEDVEEEWINRSFDLVRDGGGLPGEKDIINDATLSVIGKRLRLREFHARRINRERGFLW